MKIVVLKGGAPRHNYFAKKIIEIEGSECLLISYRRLGKNRLVNMLRKSPPTFFNRITKYLYYFVIRWNKREEQFFGKNEFNDELVFESLNASTTIEQIRKFNPDLILSFGIPIISNKIISIPKYGAINLHGGISPEYKGGNTIFWPLLKNEIHLAGATIHYMVQKVDSGDILSKVYPDINATDDEFSVSAKTFKYATDEVILIVKKIMSSKSSLKGEQQKDPGHLYLARHRTFFKNIIGPLIIRKNLKNIKLGKRVERFY